MGVQRPHAPAGSRRCDNYDGNVHLGLDAAKLWVAWDRGHTMGEDLYSGHWDFWAQADVPLDDLRDRYGVSPLDPAMAAVGDADVQRSDFERPGVAPPPPVSSIPLTDHPPVAPNRAVRVSSP